MLKNFLLLFSLLCITELNAQTYSYSFRGELSKEQSESLNQRVSELNHILTTEIRYKSEKQVGEIIFSVDPMDDRGENDHPFSPVEIKAILVSLSLEPADFRQLK